MRGTIIQITPEIRFFLLLSSFVSILKIHEDATATY